MSDVPEVMPRFSGDGTYMATLDRVVDAAAQRLRVWDTRSGTVKAEFVVGQDGGKAAASPSAVFTCLAWATIEVAASGSGGDAVASKVGRRIDCVQCARFTDCVSYDTIVSRLDNDYAFNYASQPL